MLARCTSQGPRGFAHGRNRILLAIVVVLGLTTSSHAIEIGVARVDVTPEGSIRLSGYLARNGESRGVQQRIWAKALAIGSDAEGAALLVTVDNLGVPDAITREVAGRLAAKVKLAPERLAISSSHTHSAPCLTNVAPNIFGKPIAPDEQARIDQYTHDLIDKLERVCLDALRNRKPGDLAWTQGKVGFAKNRRTNGGPVDYIRRRCTSCHRRQRARFERLWSDMRVTARRSTHGDNLVERRLGRRRPGGDREGQPRRDRAGHDRLRRRRQPGPSRKAQRRLRHGSSPRVDEVLPAAA